MSAITEKLADQLAQDVIAAAEAMDDDTLVDEIARALGTSSPTTEEMFRTFVRVRTAEKRARRMLEQKIAKHRQNAPESGEDRTSGPA
jgi:predicted component of type VI protein secretion system